MKIFGAFISLLTPAAPVGDRDICVDNRNV